MSDPSVLVACLCAQWCGVCRDYRQVFEQVGARFPQARFVWIDVEDQDELVDPIDVVDFPTLLIALGDQVRFFSVVTPQAGTLERLVRERTQGAASATPVEPEVAQLLLRLRRAI